MRKVLGRTPVRIVPKPSPRQQKAEDRAALQAMAAKVQDEAHWQEILSSAETDAQREELERVIGPLLPFRRPADGCTTPDCASGLPGLWQPVLVVASPLNPSETSWVPIELRLCDACRREATLEDFVTDHIWRQVLDAWDRTTPPPVRRLTSLQWDRIH